MPKTTTNAFDLQWQNSSVRKASYRIQFKRRYSNGSAFVWESSWTVLKPSQILKVGQISWKLDDAQGGKALASNFTLTLDNKREKWNPSNTLDSVWRKDTIALIGYESYLTQWQVLYGYLLADGTFERPAIFTGFSETPQFESGTRKATFSITGREIMLEGSNAQAISTTFTNEATTDAGDGSRLVFPTGKKSLWDISQVRIDGTVKVQGTDYTLSDMSDADEEAVITFLIAPGNTLVVDFNGQQWKRDQQISTLVGLLCDEANIGSGERTIEEPVFDSVDQSSTITSQADWETGVGTDLNTKTLVDSIEMEDGGFSDDGTDISRWTKTSGTTLIDTNGYLELTGAASNYYRTATGFYGTWEVDVRFSQNSSWPGGTFTSVFEVGNGVSPTNSYRVELTQTSNTNVNVELIELEDFSRTQIGSTVGVTVGTGFHTFKLTRLTDGSMVVYFDAVSKITGTNNKFSTGATHIIIQLGQPTTGKTQNLAMDNFEINTVETATWESGEIDMLAAPSEYLSFIIDKELNGGTISFSTNVSNTSGSGFDGFVNADANDVPQSNLKRYLKYRILITTISGRASTPVVHLSTLNWRSASLFIAQADFSGQDALASITELAKLGNMEFGFNGDGTFFFRNKTDGSTPDFTLTEKNAIAKVTNLRPGFKEVQNVIQVRYGNDDRYYSEHNSTTEGESFPTSQDTFRDRIVTLSFSRFLFSNSASVSDAISAKHYQGLPRRRATLLQRITPQMDLSDTVSASFTPDPKLIKVVFGDDMQEAFPSMTDNEDGPTNVTLPKMLAKVIGIKFDVENRKQTTEIREIL